MAVGRDDTVYVTGFAQYKATGTVYDYATVAYRGANGKSKWVARYRGVPGGTNIPSAITVSPRGDRVFVTGQSDQRFSTVPGTVPDVYLPTFATVGYSSGGKKLWASRYTPQNAPALATTLTVDPSGRKLFVAGAYGSANGLFNVTYIATLGYDAAKGGQQWVARYDVRDPANPGSNFPVGVVTNPKGTVVYEVSTLSPAPDAARGTACSTVSRCKADAGDLLLLSYPA